MIGGLKVYVNDHRHDAHVKRTWKERFWSWPWKPWVKTKWDQNAGEYVIPDGQVLRFKNEIFCNLNTFKVLETDIDDKENK